MLWKLKLLFKKILIKIIIQKNSDFDTDFNFDFNWFDLILIRWFKIKSYIKLAIHDLFFSIMKANQSESQIKLVWALIIVNARVLARASLRLIVKVGVQQSDVKISNLLILMTAQLNVWVGVPMAPGLKIKLLSIIQSQAPPQCLQAMGRYLIWSDLYVLNAMIGKWWLILHTVFFQPYLFNRKIFALQIFNPIGSTLIKSLIINTLIINKTLIMSFRTLIMKPLNWIFYSH